MRSPTPHRCKPMCIVLWVCVRLCVVVIWQSELRCTHHTSYTKRKSNIPFQCTRRSNKNNGANLLEQCYCLATRLYSKRFYCSCRRIWIIFLELCDWSHRISVCAWGAISGFQYFDSFQIWRILNYVQTHMSWFTTT